MPTTIKLRLSKNAIRKLFGAEKTSISKDLKDVLNKYSEKVNDDALKDFIRERR
ncbi:MAG: hypothetical protein GSR77_04320 [Desulfurococcales archaeon]|nr:hypothetical protein [Desulfurococcales archaeon]